MSGVFLLLSVLALLKLLVEEGQRAQWVLRLAHAGIYVLFLALIHPWTLQVSKLWVDSTLNTPLQLGNVTLLVMLDVMLVMAAATAQNRWPTRHEYHYYGLMYCARMVGQRLAIFIPSVLAFPALFYVRVVLLFELPGMSFWLVTGAMMLVTAALVLLAPWVVRWLRWGNEVVVLLCLTTLAIVVMAYMFAPQSRVVAPSVGNGWATLLQAGLLVLLLVAGGGIGYLLYRAGARWKRGRIM